ncbi:hypothetical protein BKA62DRAFT_581842, partial [Auriculariales sp. MPI-PUGE-AT-0066]
LVGLIPGPGKPTGLAINNFTAHLVDELLRLWEGIYMLRTWLFASGRLVRGALGPVICDLDAVRALIGMHGVVSSHPCTFCHITYRQVQQRDTSRTWRMRDLTSYAAAVQQSANAVNESQRGEYWTATGVRDSPLLRLPYWNPLRWVVIDPMHNWLLGQLGTQLTDVFGM